MKFLVMLGGLAVGIVLGHFPGPLGRSKPSWWRWLAIVMVGLTIAMAFLPPTAGTATDVVFQHRIDSSKSVPVALTIQPSQEEHTEDAATLIPCVDSRSGKRKIFLRCYADVSAELKAIGDGRTVIVLARRAESDQIFQADEVVTVDPFVTLPYIVGLETSARILFFHVPMSWISVIAYMLSMIFAIQTIRTRSLETDDLSVATAAVGTLFAVLATVTGAVWAKFMWGAFWNWDPRQTSIFILLLIYGAYFLLRGAIDNAERRARLSAAYSVVAFVTVPFLVFVLPRLLPGLHPGSAEDPTAGPLLSLKSDSINPTKQWVFGLAMWAFTMIFYWLVNIDVRLRRVQRGMLQKEFQ